MLRALIQGLLSRVPRPRRREEVGGGNSQSARYCYSVWLRHLRMAHGSGLTSAPRIVAELGPGNSLGVGLCALMSGAEKCFALDVVHHVDLERNLEIFDELLALFRARAPIPDEQELPHVKPYLDGYEFPAEILTDELLDEALSAQRIQLIRDSLRDISQPNSMIEYKVPWADAGVIQSGQVDMIYSQAVLEHVEDLANTYRAMHSWLHDSGLISHQIDFRCHGSAAEWNGHWRYNNWLWKLIKGNRHDLINRMPLSAHKDLLLRSGFKLLQEVRVTSPSRFSVGQLAGPFRSISQEDIQTSGAFLLARKL